MKRSIVPESVMDISLFILLFFLSFYGLGSYGLLDNNEGLYGQIPREMLETGRYIIPHLNGVPYIEKPPLLYWLIAGIYKISGVSETTARFIPASAGLGLSIAVYFFARAEFSVTIGRLSAFILSTLGGLIVFSRMVFFDVVLTFFLTISLFSFFQWSQTKHKNKLRLFYVFLALGILTKGFVALILEGLVVSLFLASMQRLKEGLKEMIEPGGLLLFLALLLPWHGVAIMQEKDFAWFYFINEHVLRFLGLRVPKDYYHGPWFYYLQRVFFTALPWSFFFPFLVKRTSPMPPALKFLWVWVGAFFCFFTLSQAKANYYLVTLFPPLALLLAFHLESFADHRLLKKICQSLGVSLSLLFPLEGLILVYYPSLFPPSLHPFVMALPKGLFWSWLGGSLVFMGTVFFLKQRPRFWPEILTGLQTVPLLVVALGIAQKAEPLFSTRRLVQEKIDQNIPLVLYRDFEKFSSLRFYRKENLPLLDSQSNDLHFGLHRPEGKELSLSYEDFERLFKGQKVYVAVFHNQKKFFEAHYPQALLTHQAGKVFLYTLQDASGIPKESLNP